MKPNILVVVMDALRQDRVGALGGRELTPHIDEFATDAVRFTSAFSTTNATDPAVTSLHTGRYPVSQGLVNHGRRVTNSEKQAIERVPQLQAVLSDAGYRTAKFGRPLGRWHRQGFDRYPSTGEGRVSMEEREQSGEARPSDTTDDTTSTKQRVATVLERIHPSLRNTAGALHRTLGAPLEFPDTDSGDNGSEATTESDRVLEHFDAFVGGEAPFYAFVHLMDTHRYQRELDTELVREYLHRYDYDVDWGDGIRQSTQFAERVASGAYPEIAEMFYFDDGAPTTAVSDAHYDVSVTHGDKRVGQILDKLREVGALDDTLVVFLADHGESLTEHGIYYDHHGLYDVSVKIPLIIRPPGGTDRTVEDLVQITDVAPTIESYVGSSGLDPDGRSLRPAIEDGESIDRTFVMAEEAHTQRRRMIRSRDRKLIYLVEGDTICRYCDVQHAEPVELYDLASDPGELENIANKDESTVDELMAEAERRSERHEQRRPVGDTGEDVTYDDEEEIHEHLEALGYR